jgi:magnesium and cobalt transporter
MPHTDKQTIPYESKNATAPKGVFDKLRSFLKPKSNEEHLREAIEEYIEEIDSDSTETLESVTSHERKLISNILKLRGATTEDVMIPRADITAIEMRATKEELINLLQEKQFSRIPVYRDTLDDVIGTVHIKDLLKVQYDSTDTFKLQDFVRDVPVIAPSLPVLDLLLMMRQTKKHMAMVVDEFGGIDGLVTIGDVIEDIVGEFEDEFDQEDTPLLEKLSDGVVMADARYDVNEFENEFGKLLTEEEREDVDTLGGLIFYIANRVPARGEIINHESGMMFEIVDADPRRVNKVRIRHIPNINAS